EQLTKRIEALLGLDFELYTKSVILPRGRLADFLGSKLGDRRDLLANILELGVYSRVAERAKKEADDAETRATEIRKTLLRYTDANREQVELRRREWGHVGQQIDEASAREEVLHGLVQKAELVATALSRLTSLQAEERARAEERDLARQQQEVADAELLSCERTIAETVAEREALGYDTRRHEVVKRAVEHLRAYDAARQESEKNRQALTL